MSINEKLNFALLRRQEGKGASRGPIRIGTFPIFHAGGVGLMTVQTPKSGPPQTASP